MGVVLHGEETVEAEMCRFGVWAALHPADADLFCDVDEGGVEGFLQGTVLTYGGT